MRTPVLAFVLLWCGCTANRFTVSAEAEARDIATTVLNAHVGGKMWRDQDGTVHAYRTFSPADWTGVKVEPDVWRLSLRQTRAAGGYFAVVTVDRRNRRTRIESCGHSSE